MQTTGTSVSQSSITKPIAIFPEHIVRAEQFDSERIGDANIVQRENGAIKFHVSNFSYKYDNGAVAPMHVMCGNIDPRNPENNIEFTASYGISESKFERDNGTREKRIRLDLDSEPGVQTGVVLDSVFEWCVKVIGDSVKTGKRLGQYSRDNCIDRKTGDVDYSYISKSMARPDYTRFNEKTGMNERSAYVPLNEFNGTLKTSLVLYSKAQKRFVKNLEISELSDRSFKFVPTLWFMRLFIGSKTSIKVFLSSVIVTELSEGIGGSITSLDGLYSALCGGRQPPAALKNEDYGQASASASPEGGAVDALSASSKSSDDGGEWPLPKEDSPEPAAAAAAPPSEDEPPHEDAKPAKRSLKRSDR